MLSVAHDVASWFDSIQEFEFRTLNAFLRKQNNTHGYFRNSRLHFAYVERRMISLDSSNLVLARMIILEAVTVRMRITVNPIPPPPARFKGVHCTPRPLRHGFTPFIDPTAMLCW